MQWCVAFLYDDALEVAKRMYVDGHETFPDLEWADGRQQFTRPNPFQGYLFVRHTHRWPSAALIAGVAKFLCYEDDDGKIYPHLVPQAVIDALPEDEPQHRDIVCHFRPADIVRIKAGPHCGLFGRFEKRHHGNAKITVEYFARSVVLSIPLTLLDLANPQSGASTAGDKRLTASA